MRKPKPRRVILETTPFSAELVKGKWIVRQTMWDKVMAKGFADRAAAETACEKIAAQYGCLRRYYA